jgi:catechol 2,3-dioxygenase-like lactoylglutathione lyase family enzyme
MDPVAIDHLNLRIPTDSRSEAIAFYGDTLGFDIERLDQYEAGETPFFAVRLTADSVLHLWPDEDFEHPQGVNYDHVSLHLDQSAAAIRERIEAEGVEIVDEREVLGANGDGRAIYVRDPFGYLVELKGRH